MAEGFGLPYAAQVVSERSYGQSECVWRLDLQTTPLGKPQEWTASDAYVCFIVPSLALDLPGMLSTPWVFWLGLATLGAGAGALRHWHATQRERQREHLVAAHAMAEQSLRANDRESALQPLVASLPSLMGATNAQILLVDSTHQQMAYFVGAKGRPRASVSMSTISGPVTCFRARETTEVADAENCPFISHEWVTKRKLKAALYVPILSGDNCVGVIEVEDRVRKRGFDAEQRALAEHLAKIAELSLRLHDQRSMTEQLHRSEKLASISEVASAMADDLGEPFTEAQRLLVEAGSPANKKLRKVSEQVSYAQDAVDRLVRFATPSSSGQEDVDLNALVSRIAVEHKTADDGRGTIKLGLNERAPLVRADPAHLEQVFQILFRHARHFVKQIEGHSLQTHTAIRDSMAVVSIAPLASAEHSMRRRLAQLPDTAENRTLGFSICQALVERAGGSLRMDPASSLGFRIDLEYPLSRNVTKSTEGAVALGRTPHGIRSGPTTALVVEPDENVRRVIVQQLAEQSVRAIPVRSSEEAKAICGRLQVDWVFCELSLPKESGIELYEAVRKRVAKFIFIVDAAACAANPEAFQASDKAVLQKPVRAEAGDALLEELQDGSVLNDA